MDPIGQNLTDSANTDLDNWSQWRQVGTPVPFTMEQQAAWLSGEAANAAAQEAQPFYRTNSRDDHMETVFELAFIRDLLYMSRTAPYLMRNARCASGLATPVRTQNGVVMAQAEAAV